MVDKSAPAMAQFYFVTLCQRLLVLTDNITLGLSQYRSRRIRILGEADPRQLDAIFVYILSNKLRYGTVHYSIVQHSTVQY